MEKWLFIWFFLVHINYVQIIIQIEDTIRSPTVDQLMFNFVKL